MQINNIRMKNSNLQIKNNNNNNHKASYLTLQ